MWRGVYLSKLPRFSRKLQVALDWTGDLFSPAEIAYLPIGTYLPARLRGGEHGAATPPATGQRRGKGPAQNGS